MLSLGSRLLCRGSRVSSVQNYSTTYHGHHPQVGYSDREIWENGPHYDLNPAQAKAIKDFVASYEKGHATLLTQYPELKERLAFRKNAYDLALADQSEPIRVAVTGAAGQIGYALLYRIACGYVFGPKTPVILQLLELPQAQGALKGVEMELRDCAFPPLVNVVCTDDPNVAFEGADYALLVGGQPRTKGMERADLLLKNADIFSVQGKALSKTAKGKNTRVVVV